MKISIICSSCNKSFERETKEYTRAIKKGWNSFCSRSCAGKQWIKNFGTKSNRDPSKILGHTNADEYTGFRKFIRLSKRRSNIKEQNCDLDLLYIKNLWEQQNGICPITGWKLLLKERKECLPNQASLDRIDNTKGYIKGNVRFVSLIANYCRNNFTDEQMLDFCSAVVYNNKK